MCVCTNRRLLKREVARRDLRRLLNEAAIASTMNESVCGEVRHSPHTYTRTYTNTHTTQRHKARTACGTHLRLVGREEADEVNVRGVRPVVGKERVHLGDAS